MPFQNRVTPFSKIEFSPARGLWMGNRGILHDENQNLKTRKWQHKAWVTCVLKHQDKNGRSWHRAIMSPQRYTELFFLDEATALSAGHRPCGLYRNKAYRAFMAALGNRFASVKELDRTLHQQRTRQILGVDKPQKAHGHKLPDGVMVTLPSTPGVAYLKRDDALYPWSHHGYGAPIGIPAMDLRVITPPLTVEAISNGYRFRAIPGQSCLNITAKLWLSRLSSGS